MRRYFGLLVALGIAAYGFIVVSAYRWGAGQRFPDGSLFQHMDNEARRKAAQSKAKDLPVQPFENVDNGPAFVAVRYDDTLVAFIVTPDAQPRFGHSRVTAQKLTMPARQLAPLAGLHELWKLPAEQVETLPDAANTAAAGESWILQLSPESSIPVSIQQPVITENGCYLASGFLATVAPLQKALFAEPRDYFVIRRFPVPRSEHAPRTSVTELQNWKATDVLRNELVQQLDQQMKQELARIDLHLDQQLLEEEKERGSTSWDEAISPVQEWKQIDAILGRNEAQLDYDIKAFQLTPDAAPRLFVRARWKLHGQLVFLMSAWFRAQSSPALLTADSRWSALLRSREPGYSWRALNNFEDVLNLFDADQDGWAELLLYVNEGTRSSIQLYRYSDLGLIPTKTELLRYTDRSNCQTQQAARE